MFRFYGPRAHLFLIGLAFLGLIAESCTSAKKTTTTPSVNTSASTEAAEMVRHWLATKSTAARSINLTGSISVDQDGSSQSATFDLKSKRLTPGGDRRIDSLSVIVSGPFGIKVARFLASPEKYAFFDVLHGETVSGATDQESLEHLTQLRGISLPMMSDLVFGILPGVSDISPDDSLLLFEGTSIQNLVIYRAKDRVTDVAEFAGSVPAGTTGSLALRRFRRWNGIITDPLNTTRTPDVTVTMGDHTLENGILLPHHIEAKAGTNTLELDYTDVQVNPANLVVRIKMP